MSGTRTITRSRARAVALVVSAVVILASLSAGGASAATAPDFTAAGSAKQVYVTGLAPSTPIQLVTATGTLVASRNANSLGAALFRDLAPGGYKVRRVSDGATSPKLTVHNESATQLNASIYDQTIPSSGYGYLTT